MRLSWATDIHLNFLDDDGVRAFINAIAAQHPDVILLCGDIAEADTLESYLARFPTPLYFVLGNHDFYGGSIALVREDMQRRGGYLPALGVVKLSPSAALVGVDGWGDGRLGNFQNSPVYLNDWRLIEEFKFLETPKRLAKLRELGEESAERLQQVLDEALRDFSRVVVVTHVPPFKESCWHEGKISDDDWLPWFTCRATGEVLQSAADRNPGKHIDVYCGHTHGGGTAQIRPNLVVHTGASDYGKPMTQNVISID